MKDSDDSLKLLVGSLAILASVLGLTGCKKSLTPYQQTRSLMDTLATIIVYAGDEQSANDAINTAFARIDGIENRASIFKETAEAFRLNRDGYLDNPSDDLRRLLTMSKDYYLLTDGYFDITVQPLLELWSQGALWQESQQVQRNRIDETIKLVSSDKIVVKNNSIYFKKNGVKITLGGIAKGYAADEALLVLQENGIKHALVNIGGDLGALGTKADGQAWRIALVNPDDNSQSLATFAFSERSAATSGNYLRYFDPDKKVHHILNPKTGYSASGCSSVTLIARDSALADALATSVFVMGAQAGLGLVESLDGVECLMVDAQGAIYQSSGLAGYLG